MKICITGYSGFLGSYLSKYLAKKFAIKKVNLRKMPNLEDPDLNKFLDKMTNSNIIINCAANLNPKTARDFFINQDFPYILQKHIKKKRKKIILIHISSINVLIRARKDPYTISKIAAEKKIKGSNVIILRLPLLYNETNGIIQKEGNLKQIHDYLNQKFLPIYPMVYPGHLYQPVQVKKILIFIENIILKERKLKKIYNIVGKDKKFLWDLYYQIASYKKKRVLKINIQYFEKLIPTFVKTNIKKNQNFFQQLLSIDHSKFLEKKTSL